MSQSLIFHSREATRNVHKLIKNEQSRQVSIMRKVPGGLKTEQVKVFSPMRQNRGWRGVKPFQDKPRYLIFFIGVCIISIFKK